MKIQFITNKGTKEIDVSKGIGKAKDGAKAVGKGLKKAGVAGLTAMLAELNKSTGEALKAVKPEGWDESKQAEADRKAKIEALYNELKTLKANG
jgi:hypothetical protein